MAQHFSQEPEKLLVDSALHVLCSFQIKVLELNQIIKVIVEVTWCAKIFRVFIIFFIIVQAKAPGRCIAAIGEVFDCQFEESPVSRDTVGNKSSSNLIKHKEFEHQKGEWITL